MDRAREFLDPVQRGRSEGLSDLPS